MNCLNPSYRTLIKHYANGVEKNYLSWTTRDAAVNGFAVPVRCSKCLNCLKFKALNWEVKLFYQSLETLNNKGVIYFITLTYDNNHIIKPDENPVHEIQKMIKRIRKNNKNLKLKYFIVNEVGSKTYRLHHHAIFFCSYDFLKPNKFKRLNNVPYFFSDFMSWPNGFHSISKIDASISNSSQRARSAIKYVLKYLLKNPIGYYYSQRLGYEYISKISNSETGLFHHNNLILKSPFYKNDLTLSEKMKYARISAINLKQTKPKKDITTSKELLNLWEELKT